MNKSRLGKVTGVSVAVIALVGIWEGYREKAYIPIPGDVPTICFGTTRGVKMGDTKTRAECEALLKDTLVEFEGRMLACSPGLAKAPNGVYVASLSLAYNIGTGAWCRSTTKKKIDAGDYKGACDAILFWDRAQGRVVQGLVNRRKDERRICLSGLPA